jgi:hypothetical protein
MKKLVLFVCLAVLATVVLLGLGAVEKARAADNNLMELDPIVVEGQIQRPEAAYIIQRATLDFGMTAKKRSFIGKVKSSIDGDPF